MAIGEKVRDAQMNPDRDTPYNEFPHRVSIQLGDEEAAILGKITKERGLPYKPERREFRYTDLVSRLDAEYQETIRRFGERARQNAIDAGFLRERSVIEEEIQDRQGNWKKNASDDPSEPQK